MIREIGSVCACALVLGTSRALAAAEAPDPTAPLDATSNVSTEILLQGPLESANAIGREPAFNPGEKGSPRIVLPSGHMELAGEMAFIMSQPFLTEEETRFSDVGLLRLRARRSLAERLELQLNTQLLAKQPSTTDEPLWQSGGLAIRVEVLEGLALSLAGNAGLLLQNEGAWWQTAPGASYKADVSRYLRFVLGAGGAFTMLHFRPQTREPFWLQEINADAEVQAGNENAAMWVGLDYSVPIASNPGQRDADTGRGFLDPQIRLGLNVGGTLSLDTDDWNAFAIFSVVDRGDVAAPATLLPILDGGFDQQQIVIGVQHHFEPKRERRNDGW